MLVVRLVRHRAAWVKDDCRHSHVSMRVEHRALRVHEYDDNGRVDALHHEHGQRRTRRERGEERVAHHNRAREVRVDFERKVEPRAIRDRSFERAEVEYDLGSL